MNASANSHRTTPLPDPIYSISRKQTQEIKLTDCSNAASISFIPCVYGCCCWRFCFRSRFLLLLFFSVSRSFGFVSEFVCAPSMICTISNTVEITKPHEYRANINAEILSQRTKVPPQSRTR